jgi:hypothetical protein
VGQQTSYNQGSKGELVYYLSTYLGYKAPDSTTRLAPAMFCPGYKRYNQNAASQTMSNAIVYCRTVPAANNLTNANGTPFDPFGYPDFNGVAGFPSSKLTSISSRASLSTVWLLVDSDKIAFSTAGWADDLPDKPVHGKIRNYIYFDNHVSTKKVGPKGQI